MEPAQFTTSVSAVELFEQCERRYLLERLLKAPRVDTMETVLGTFYHDVFANLNEMVFKGTVVQSRDISEVICRLFQKHRPSMQPFPVKEEELYDECQANMERILPYLGVGRFHAIELMPGIPLIERKFFKNKLGFNGIVDLGSRNAPVVDDRGQIYGWDVNEPCIVDLKLLSGARRRSARDAVVSAQLALYALDTGVRRAAYLEVPRNLEREVQVRTVLYADEELERWRIWFAQIFSALRLRQEKFMEMQGRTTVMGPEGLTQEQAIRLLGDVFPMTPRTNALCSSVWCPHFFTCYPQKVVDTAPQAQ